MTVHSKGLEDYCNDCLKFVHIVLMILYIFYIQIETRMDFVVQYVQDCRVVSTPSCSSAPCAPNGVYPPPPPTPHPKKPILLTY